MTAKRQPGTARKPRGFAAIFAIALIIVVGGSLAVLGNHFAAEATRTRAQRADAHLRQLITAGAAIAIHRAEYAAAEKAVILPSSLAGDGASLTIDLTGEGDARTAVVRVQFGDRRTDETFKLRRTAGQWHVQ